MRTKVTHTHRVMDKAMAIGEICLKLSLAKYVERYRLVMMSQTPTLTKVYAIAHLNTA